MFDTIEKIVRNFILLHLKWTLKSISCKQNGTTLGIETFHGNNCTWLYNECYKCAEGLSRKDEYMNGLIPCFDAKMEPGVISCQCNQSYNSVMSESGGIYGCHIVRCLLHILFVKYDADLYDGNWQR